MAQQSLPITNFQTADGTAVANGQLTIRLNIDGNVNDTSINTRSVTVTLDTNGAPVGNPQFWPNNEISPTGTYYVINVYEKNGQLVGGPLSVTV